MVCGEKFDHFELFLISIFAIFIQTVFSFQTYAFQFDVNLNFFINLLQTNSSSESFGNDIIEFAVDIMRLEFGLYCRCSNIKKCIQM